MEQRSRLLPKYLSEFPSEVFSKDWQKPYLPLQYLVIKGNCPNRNPAVTGPLEVTIHYMVNTIISTDPSLYLKNSGIVGLAFCTLQDTFAEGTNREHWRPLPPKYQDKEKQPLNVK